MSFEVSQESISGYFRDGYIVFRSIIPPALLADLRAAADKARVIAREVRGGNAQRIQPLDKFADRLPIKPFEDFLQLPALHQAIEQLLGPGLVMGGPDVMGVFFEPATAPWCTAWHRDMTLQSSRLAADEFENIFRDWRAMNQINCPLYTDTSLWYVPGSHVRSHDLAGEAAAGPMPVENVTHDKDGKPTVVQYSSRELVARELRCVQYARSMPGAINLVLEPGDFALYRALAWHLGSYSQYRVRSTLHTALFTPEAFTWWKAWRAGGSPPWTGKAQSW